MPWKVRILMIGLALLAVGSFGAIAQQAIDPTFLPSLPDTIMATLSPQYSPEDYIQKYQQAEVALNKSDWVSAERLLKDLKFQNNPLQPVVLLQLAKSEAEQGQEGAAEYNLQLLANRYRLTTFYPLAKYQLAQSFLRSSQTNKAKATFEEVLDKFPKSQLGLGCHYYLGQLAQQENKLDEAKQHWETYIQNSQEGRLSPLAVEGLLKLKTPLSVEDNKAIAQINLNNANWQAALDAAKQLPEQDKWLLNAKALQGLNKSSEALSALSHGLQFAKSQDEADDAIELLTKLSGSNTKSILFTLAKQPEIKWGKDTLLWELAKRAANDTEKQGYQQQLLTHFPNSNWSPETMWSALFNQLRSGQAASYINQADTFMGRYPNSRAAAKVLFWKAKLLRQQNQNETANNTFKQLIDQYPGNYFSQRAEQLISGQAFPLKLNATFSNNPSTAINYDELTPFLPLDSTAQSALMELMKAKASTTASTLLETFSDLEGKQPHPYFEAAIRNASGDQYSAIKLIDKYLAKQLKTGKAAEAFKNMPRVVQQIWYPLPYSDSISKWSQTRGISPLLTASIIRQESAYNPIAISSSKALGLMQLLPSTATEVAKTDGLKSFLPQELFLPDTNIRLGTRYLQYLQQRFSGATIFMVGAYNGGPNAMSKWVTQAKATAPNADLDWFVEQIPYDQTREYIQHVYAHFANYKAIYATTK